MGRAVDSDPHGASFNFHPNSRRENENARKLVVIVILLNKFGPAPSFLLFSNLIRLFQLQKNVHKVIYYRFL